MRQLRFCLVTTFYPPYNFGGDGVFVYRLAHALARRGHQVAVIHAADAFELLGGRPASGGYPDHPNITIHALRGSSRLDALLSHQLGRPTQHAAALERILDREQFDVIHFHNISLLGGPGVLAYGRGVKLCTMHDYWFVCATHVLWRFDREPCTQRTCLACTLVAKRPPQLWRYTGAIAQAAQHVDAFLAGSDFACQAAAANGFPAAVRRLAHFMPDAEADSPATAAPHARPYFLYVGRLERLKGPQTLVEAFRQYRAADLIIVGAGALEAELRAAAAELPHIHIRSWTPHHQLRGLYQGAIAALLPSLCYETFGLVGIEAFAAGTPLIVHAIGALPELVEPTRTGLIYRDQAELLVALESLRANPELRATMGAQGRLRYQNSYTEQRHMQDYLALIEEIQASKAEQGATA